MKNAMIVAMLFLAMDYVVLANGFDRYRIARLCVATSGILFTFALSIIVCRKKKLLLIRFLGEYSLPVYLMHVLAYKVAFLVLFALHINNYLIFLVVGSVVGLVVPAYVYRYLERKGFLYLFNMNRCVKRL